MDNPNKPELPRVGNQNSDVITAEHRWTETFIVNDGGISLYPASGEKFTRVGIQNPTYDDSEADNLVDIFIGGPSVTSTGSTRGRILSPGQDRDEDTTLAPHALCKTGETAVITVEFSL